MSGFRMTITVPANTPAAEIARLQAIVDETCEPAPQLPSPTDLEIEAADRASTNVPLDLNKENL